MTANLSPAADQSTPDTEGWQTLRRFLPYLWPKNNWPLRRRIVIALIFVLLAKAVTLALPFAYSGAVDSMSADSDLNEGVWVALALVAAYGATY